MALRIGRRVTLGWNGAKALGCEAAAYEDVTVEALGPDWVVVRSPCYGALAAVFGKDDNKLKLLTE